ncbi:unnamed protein product [Didymodactylos carnosus]|uniref:EGF domain-specific O-linked N-acetylglucosamine transferase n=2 Tax=Didymodactylos carnosus TaxID=1234261 RepID=A0A814BRZ6_9BILA|nr:unnamed protein product [Didymodactylos carnosus]CAF3709118.1 unnamed protein product [Didymodactylos carnosus]
MNTKQQTDQRLTQVLRSVCSQVKKNITTICDSDNTTAIPVLFSQWCKNQVNFCSSSVIVYDQLFALTRSVILNSKLVIGSQGGEDIQDVLNQSEDVEFYQFKQGFIQIPCSNDSLLRQLPVFGPRNDFTEWALSIDTYNSQQTADKCNTTQVLGHVIDDFTIAVRRRDYANWYHTITDLYTVYILCRFFNRDPKTAHILFVDGHPKGNLDSLWSTLFHSYQRAGQYRASNRSMIFYQELLWSYQQELSHLDISRAPYKDEVIYLDDFRQHVFTSFNIKLTNDSAAVNCDLINIFFLLRKNYVAHPRNPTGKVERQINNEMQVLQELQAKLNESKLFSKNTRFKSNYFETLSMYEQLSIILNTDILLGVHGAGLTHVLFMKKNRGIIELSLNTGLHFFFLAQARNVNHLYCPVQQDKVSATDIVECITNMLSLICPSNKISSNTIAITSVITTISTTLITSTTVLSTSNSKYSNSTINQTRQMTVNVTATTTSASLIL